MTTGTENVAGASVSHSHADVSAVEAACANSQRQAVQDLLSAPAVSEAFVLQTCNRAEAYVVAADDARAREPLADHFAAVPSEAVRELSHEAGLRHLMRTACGLESLVLGEDQIIGLVQEAYEDARAAGGTGPTLEDAVLKALHVGERARDETAIQEGAVSLGSAAVRLLQAERDFESATALVVGAGEIATLSARALADPVDRVIVADRTLPHAEYVVYELDVDGMAIGLDAIPVAVAAADVLITATGSDDYVLERGMVQLAGATFVVDLARPRDVDPAVGELTHVDVRDLDALEAVTEANRRRRRAAAARVEELVETEYEQLLSQYKRKRADEVIGAIYEGAEHIKTRELDTALAKLDAKGNGDGISDHERAVLESMADALIGQLLAPHTQSLREAAENDDWTTINTALQLFGHRLNRKATDSLTRAEGPELIAVERTRELPDALE